MTKSALIVGGTGQVGYASAAALLDAGYEVTLGSRAPLDGPSSLPVRHRVLDRENTEQLLAAARAHDVVVDVVAFTPAHATQLAQLAGDVESLVVISTGSVYQGADGRYFDIARGDDTAPQFPVPVTEDLPTIHNSATTYGPLKADMERALLAVEGLPVSILRPAAIHGPRGAKLREWYFIKRAMDGRAHVPLARMGLSRFSTSSTVNIAALVAACAGTPGARVLNAVDEENLTAAGIARTVFEVMGHTSELFGFEGPPRDGLGATPWDAPHPFVCSMAAAREQVGYVPAVTYAQAVAIDVEWVLARLAEEGGGEEAWQRVFPAIVSRYGVEGWFPYDAEDRLIADGGAASLG